MSSNSRKRKYRSNHRPYHHSAGYQASPVEQFLSHHGGYNLSNAPVVGEGTAEETDPLQALYFQAHEADIVRGPTARVAAQSLEVVEYQTVDTPDGTRCITVPKRGSALIRVGGEASTGCRSSLSDEEDEASPPQAGPITMTGVWVDRYDARLLLHALPTIGTGTSVNALSDSPTGWSDLPSDSEDTFFLNPTEVEDYRRDKRRRQLERAREERLKARMEEDEPVVSEEDVWGGSDEEPGDTVKQLIERTAVHILSSPNPAQLEMRILANHGADERFAFLRGRWSRAWNLAKAKVRLQKEEKEKKPEKPPGLGLLTGYGSDESDSGNEDGDTKEEIQTSTATETLTPAEMDEEAAKEARRKRLKEWTEKRRMANG